MLLLNYIQVSPTAFAVFPDKRPVQVRQTIETSLRFDLHSSTFDVSILKVGDGI